MNRTKYQVLSTKYSVGFSLVELIVVVTIIAVISVVGMVSFTGANKKARDNRRQADLEKIRISRD